MIYLFNNFQVDTDNFVLKSEESLIEVEPLVFNLIVYLIENKSKLVSRDELLENVWQGRIVLDATLNNHIKSARNALGDNGQSQNVIKTFHSRGYQFVAEVNALSDKSTSNTNKKYLLTVLLFVVASIIVFHLSNNLNIFNEHSSNQATKNKSIAVLAFLDMSPEQNQEYFSDGISEEILNKMAQIPKLRVISRTSSFFFKGKDDTAKQIGEQLNVSHILEGSVRKHKDKVRITVQLIEIETSTHLWSETYDRTMNDIFQIQDDIADAVSEKLQTSLLSNSNGSNTAHPEAYNVFLQARHLIQKSNKEGLKKAELKLKKSLAFDPQYAPAWHQLAKTIFSLTFNYGVRSTNDGIKTATYAVNKAIALNPYYAPPYATLARIQSQQRRFIDADKTMLKALSLDNNNSYINTIAASNAMFSGDFDLALNYRAKVKSINPKNYSNYYGIGMINFLKNDFQESYNAFKKYESAKPDASVMHYLMCGVSLAQGKKQQALVHANMEKDEYWKLYALNMALFADGQVAEADKLFGEYIDRYSNSDLANIARIYAFRGNIEKSFEWLYKAFDHPDSTLIHLLNFPDFIKMHNDTRWHKLIRKMNFPPTHWLVKKLP